MLSFTGGLKVFVALEPVDLRKSFSGLEGLVGERLGEDLRQGALFVFTNRRHSRLKILYWDGSEAAEGNREAGGWASKVVAADQAAREGDPFDFAQGRLFSWPKSVDPQTVKLKLAPEALAMLTDGIDLRGARLRPWYERE